MEAYYRTRGQIKDDKGEYEWYEYETYEGEKKRVKKYKDPSII